MNTAWVNQITRLAKDNAPTILSAVAVAGVAATAVLAVKATPKASKRLKELEAEGNPAITKREIVEATWKFYVPAVLSGAGTIACIVGANQIGLRQKAALAAAAAMFEQGLREYKDKVVEVIGEKKEQEVHDKIMQDRIDKNPPDKQVVILAGGDQLCLESLSGRYFRSDHETIRRIQNDLNAEIMQQGYIALNDVWESLGLEQTPIGNELGWNIDHQIEFRFSSHLTPNSEPCLAVGYGTLPFVKYGSLY